MRPRTNRVYTTSKAMWCDEMIRTSIVCEEKKHTMINLNDDAFPTMEVILSKHNFIRCTTTKTMVKKVSNFDDLWSKLQEKVKEQLN